MTDVLVLFGSDSDSRVYERIVRKLQVKGFDIEMRIASAHRTPKHVEKIVKKSDAKIVVSGAGLAAALPGVVASLTEKLVIGVPVGGNYAGLDAFLSISQMPPGIPVLCAGVENSGQVVAYVEMILKKKNFVTLIKASDDDAVVKAVEKAKNLLHEFGIKCAVVNNTTQLDDETVYINFVDISRVEIVDNMRKLVLYVPVEKDSDSGDAAKTSRLSKNGLWLGLNRGENAALAAVQILNLDGKYTSALKEYREKMREKVLKADDAERVRYG